MQAQKGRFLLLQEFQGLVMLEEILQRLHDHTLQCRSESGLRDLERLALPVQIGRVRLR